MSIRTIQGLRLYLHSHSGFVDKTVNNVIKTLGFPLNGSKSMLSELSTQLENCAEYGADIGISGFIYYNETSSFYRKNKHDIVSHMENTAAEFGTDIISMVQGFGVFRNSEKPTPSKIGKALYGNSNNQELTSLYNVFAWYALEEISRTWYRYLEDNPAYHAELSA